MYLKVVMREKHSKPGAFRVVTDDGLFIVTDSGEEVDISRLVTSWKLDSDIGEPRVVRVAILGFEVVVEKQPADKPELSTAGH